MNSARTDRKLLSLHEVACPTLYLSQPGPLSSEHSQRPNLSSQRCCCCPLSSVHEITDVLESRFLPAPAQSSHLAFSVLPTHCCIWKPGAQGIALGLLKPFLSPSVFPPYIESSHHAPSPYHLLPCCQTTIPVYIPQGFLISTKGN